jgi:NADPH2:quinone reductase
MRAVLCRAWGPPESLTVEEIAAPDPGPGEVAVNVKATALNFFDTLIIAGKYQFKPAFPFSPGAEVAGIVKAAGKGVVGFDAGDRVVAWTGWGGCREEMVVGADQLVPLPDAIDFATASALTVTYGTTLHALRDRAKLKPGETLAVLGAAGGTGQAAVELGKIMGARVIACASSDDKLAFCRSLGADEGVNYASEDLKDRLKALTGGAGVDVVYDPVGGSLAEAALRSTAWEGRFLVVGFAAGEIPKIPTNLLLVKGSAMLGVFWGEDVKRNPERHRTNMASLLNWCLEGRIRPHIHRTYRLEETAAALQSLARREVKGKVVVVP